MTCIPSGIFTKYGSIADEMLSTFGISCKLVYVDKIQVSATAAPTPKKIKVMNLQNMGPDTGFKRGNTSFKTVETTDDITLRVYWSKKDFRKIGEIDLPDGSIMAIGNYSDLTNINKASFLLIHSDRTGHKEWKFQKAAEPVVFGLDDNYLASYWSRV